MILAALNVVKIIINHWRVALCVAAMISCAAVGYGVRGYICVASQNKAIAAAVAETQKKEGELYAKAMEQEKRKRAIRERARAASVGINSLPNDACGDSPIPASWMRIIQNAYDNIAG